MDSQLLRRAAAGIKTIDLENSDLTTIQLTSLLEAILAEEELVLESLNMLYNDLSDVNDQLLAEAVVRIKSAKLCNTRLTTEQIATLLQTILAEKELAVESLDMRANNLREVDGQLLAGAVVRIKSVKLCNTRLTTDQMTTLLQVILAEKDLVIESLDMRGNKSQVAKELKDSVRKKVKIFEVDSDDRAHYDSDYSDDMSS